MRKRWKSELNFRDLALSAMFNLAKQQMIVDDESGVSRIPLGNELLKT